MFMYSVLAPYLNLRAETNFCYFILGGGGGGGGVGMGFAKCETYG